MSNVLPAAIAFFALGANLIGTAFLLLFEPRSRALRWYAIFELDIMVWLALQGWVLATDDFTPASPSQRPISSKKWRYRSSASADEPKDNWQGTRLFQIS